MEWLYEGGCHLWTLGTWFVDSAPHIALWVCVGSMGVYWWRGLGRVRSRELHGMRALHAVMWGIWPWLGFCALIGVE